MATRFLGRAGAPVLASPGTHAADRDADRVRAVARILDRKLVDPVLGFIVPGVGDVLSAGAGLYVVALAIRHRLPAVVIARMLLNLTVDTVIGVIPLIGDLFDLFHKAHTKNAQLFLSRVDTRRGRWTDWLVLASAFVLFLLALLVPLWLLSRVWAAIW